MAHPLNNGYSQLTVVQDGVDYELFIPEISLLKYDRNNDGALSAEELNSQKAAMENEMKDKVRLAQDMEPLEFSLRGLKKTEKEMIPGVSFSLHYTSQQPIRGFTIDYELLFDQEDPNHLNFALILDGEDVDQTIFDSAHRSYYFESLHPATAFSTLWKYYVLGIEHILTGFDHLLFLFSLILVAEKYRDIVKIVTAFTVAHSITLLLASLGFIALSPVWVESSIALTICYVAAENIWRQRHRLRWAITFGFGLIHGLGFAGALKEIGLPKQHFIGTLVTFNLGVETGQLAVVFVALPLLLWLRKRSGYRAVVIVGSVLIFIQALWWVLERTGIVPGGE